MFLNLLFNLIYIPVKLFVLGALALILLVGVAIAIVLGLQHNGKPKKLVPVKNILKERDKIKARIEVAQGEPAMLKCGDLIRRFQGNYYDDPDCYQYTKELWDAYNGQACVVETKRLVKV